MIAVRWLGNFINSARSRGLRITTRLYLDRLLEALHERRLGVSSGEIISLKELGLEHEERRAHGPTLFRDFRKMQRFLRPRSTDEVFIDYGSGLGRMLILAATFPYKRVIGIEISPILAERARANITQCRRKLRCKDVTTLTIDATTFDVPADTTTIYFNNPFAGAILDGVLNKIRQSYEQCPRQLKLICNLPHESAFYDQIISAKGFRIVEQFSLAQERRCVVLLVGHE